MIHINQLTTNQQDVCDEIIRTWQCGELLPNLRHRCTPFVTGTSGSGKTTTVRAALAAIAEKHKSQNHNAEIQNIELNTMHWIVSGSAGRIKTLDTLNRCLEQVSQNPHGLLLVHIDELDKLAGLTQANHNASYFRGVMQEVQELLERTPAVLGNYQPTLNEGQGGDGSKERRRMYKCLKNAFIIGSGAFQDYHQKRSEPISLLGCADRQIEPAVSRHAEKLEFDGNDLQLFSRMRWLELAPPTRVDLEHAAKTMLAGPAYAELQPKILTCVDKALATATPYRTLECLLLEKCCASIAAGRLPYLVDVVAADIFLPKSGFDDTDTTLLSDLWN